MDNFTPEQLAAALAAKRAYERKYRAEHKEQIKASNQRYWVKKGSQITEVTFTEGERQE